MDPFDTLTCCALVGRLAAALAASVDPSVVLSSRLAVRPPGWRIEALRSGLTAEIDLVRVVETPTGERIDDVNALIDILEDATIILEETGTTSIAGFDARVVDVTAEANPRPRTEDVILRFSTSGDGGFVPPAEGRFWILDTPRGLLLLTAEVLEPGAADLGELITEAETIWATLELIDPAA